MKFIGVGEEVMWRYGFDEHFEKVIARMKTSGTFYGRITDPRRGGRAGAGILHSFIEQPMEMWWLYAEEPAPSAMINRYRAVFVFSKYMVRRCWRLGIKVWPEPLRFPVNVPYMEKVRSSHTVLWAHADRPEKNLGLMFCFADRHPELSFTVTSPCARMDGILRMFVGQMGAQLKVCPTTQDLWGVMGEHEFFISTSYRDNFGVSVVEAAQAGCRVVVPRDFAFPEYLPGTNLYEPYSLRDMYRALCSSMKLDSGFAKVQQYRDPIEHNVRVIREALCG